MNFSRAQLAPLTTARFFAALHVVFFHAGERLVRAAPEAVRDFQRCGYSEVSFFFVLSGFVLSYNYGGSDGGKRFDTRRFWTARLARIYPMYLLSLIALGGISLRIFGLAFFTRQVPSGIANVLLVQSWWPAYALTWNFPGWSVSVEAFFYLVFPLVAVVLRGADDRRRLVLLMTVVWAIGLLAVAAYLWLEPDREHPWHGGSDGFWLRAVTYGPPARLPEFVVGAILGRIFVADRRQGTRAKGAPMVALGVSGLILLFGYHSHLPFGVLHAEIAVPFFSLIVFGLAHGAGWLGELFALPFFVVLGNASYSMYILQAPVALWLLTTLGKPPRIAQMSGPLFVVYVALLVGLSLLAHRYVEWPLRQVLRPRPARAADLNAGHPRCQPS